MKDHKIILFSASLLCSFLGLQLKSWRVYDLSHFLIPIVLIRTVPGESRYYKLYQENLTSIN